MTDPDKLARYPVRGRLGAGGMGEVLRVHDDRLGRDVAAKRIRGAATGSQARRFLLEARVTGQLQHPNIVPVYELGETSGGDQYFTMKQVEGRTLEALIDELRGGAGAALVERLQIFLKVCDAMAFAHDRGVIHRDLKPSNIMVGRFGEVLVVDWGLAKVLGQPDPIAAAPPAGATESADTKSGRPMMTQDGVTIGTPAYMPPEQAVGATAELDQRSDIYALGAILYEMLALVPPFAAMRPVDVLEAVVAGHLVPPATRAAHLRIPWELEAVVMRAMAYDPEQRYPDAATLRTDVETFLAGGLLAAAAYRPWHVIGKWIGRHKVMVGAASLVLLSGLLFGGLWLSGRLEAQRRVEAALSDAQRERDAARDAREAAELARADAQQQRDDVLQLGDVKLLTELDKEALEELWLSRPTPAELRTLEKEIARWTAGARALTARLPRHRASLDKLRTAGRETPEGWVFDDHRDQWRHDVLAQLVGWLAELGRQGGRVQQVQRRLDHYRNVEKQTITDRQVEWATATKRIASRYKLDVPPQLGIVPVGVDKTSGLSEFALFGSGDIPRRGPAGRLALDDHTAVVLVLIPGGRFWMGAVRQGAGNRDAQALPDEGPVGPVTLAPFLIGKYEMTQWQWLKMTGSNPSAYRAGGDAITVRHPVENVSWNDCRWLVVRAGLTLPSEAQWEFAARAGTRTAWPTGDDPRQLAGTANLADVRYHRGGGTNRHEPWLDDGHVLHAPVGSYRPNAFGLHDMIGNVFEWCIDPYLPRAYQRRVATPMGLRDIADRLLYDKKIHRVYRGGSWHVPAVTSRVAKRSSAAPANRRNSLGLRLARQLIDDD